ncbi:MAG: DUF169 domain-containing protein [Eggerthellaceae bacterium]
MEACFRDEFARTWKTYFGNAELPITMRYADRMPAHAESPAQAKGPHHCIIDTLNQVRKGSTIAFSKETIRCGGGMHYLGYVENFDAYHAHIAKFLSETERYKETPECVRAYFNASVPEFRAPAPYCVFAPWNAPSEEDPDLVIFFSEPDTLSGLVGLANFEHTDADGVICPWGSGCSSIVMFPYLERDREDPRAVLGMFDPSARPCVGPHELTFALPFELFKHLASRMDDTFLTTKAWERVRARMK